MRRAWIISIGTELTLGQTVDTNSAWLSRELAALGIRPLRHLTLPDELPDIAEALAGACRHCELALVTGGLGPTADDLTREALAAVAGVPLELNAASLREIEAFFAARGRTMSEANRSQALCPRGAAMISNSCGTAPGIHARIGDCELFVMPGVPSEMTSMFAAYVAPRIRALGAGSVLRSRVVQTFGMGESDLGARIRDLMQRGRNPEIGTTAALGVIGVRINAMAADPAAADALLDQAEAELRARLGPLVYGIDDQTLAGAVGQLLRDTGRTLSTAESCTGGLIGKLLTDQPGSSAYFVGGTVAYTNSAKTALLGVDARLIAQHGAVSEPVVRQMAAGAQRAHASDYAVAVSGIAGPDGGTPEKPVGTVCIAAAGLERTDARTLRLGADASRDAIRQRAATAALNALRLMLLNQT
ncbi:MAG: Nicotinamide-nucleotide amidohydrolase PncC [Phycisphaerae bacterium]|nr:Nicotinamide-nucleotide amidohydrolase PncC [Phycisphaerae bacterium]